MANPWVSRLQLGCDLTLEDRRILIGASTAARRAPAGADLISEGESPQKVHLILDGVACRYKGVQGGRRQIVGLLLAGDLSGLQGWLPTEMDHSVSTLTPCRVVDFSQDAAAELLRHSRIARALWRTTLMDQAILREWLVCMGRRSADARLAHLLCEFHARLRRVGCADPTACDFPLTQLDLADVLGLSQVQVNRSMQALRHAKLIVLNARRLTLLDPDGLAQFSGFDLRYLRDRPWMESEPPPTALTSMRLGADKAAETSR